MKSYRLRASSSPVLIDTGILHFTNREFYNGVALPLTCVPLVSISKRLLQQHQAGLKIGQYVTQRFRV